MTTISVLDSTGSTVNIEQPLAPGRAAASASKPVALSNEDKAALDLLASTGTEYETVAASQTDQVLGAAGAAGDVLTSLLIVPATTSPGAVSIKDGSGSAVTVFTGGAGSVTSLIPFTVYLGAVSTSGAWKVTTGANASVIATGSFS